MVFLDNRQTGCWYAIDNSVPEPRSIKNHGEQVAQELSAIFSGILTIIGDLFLTAQALSLKKCRKLTKVVERSEVLNKIEQ